jgi:hypothetical protein
LRPYAGPSTSIARGGGLALKILAALLVASIVSGMAPWFFAVGVAIAGVALAVWHTRRKSRAIGVVRVDGQTLSISSDDGRTARVAFVDLENVTLDAKTQYRAVAPRVGGSGRSESSAPREEHLARILFVIAGRDAPFALPAEHVEHGQCEHWFDELRPWLRRRGWKPRLV